MNNKFQNVTIGVLIVASGILKGLDTFVLSQKKIQPLKEEVSKLSERVKKLEARNTDD